MRLFRLAETTRDLRGTSSRKEKSEILAALLGDLDPQEIVPTIGMLLATPRQGAIGVGWATVAKLDSNNESWGSAESTGSAESLESTDSTADIMGFDQLLSEIAVTNGTGSEAARTQMLNKFLAGCSNDEADFVRRVLVGDARQGALAGVMTDAVAKASGVKAAIMRRGVMLQGDLGEAAYIALTGGQESVAAIDLEVGRPIQPMLASTSPDVDEAIAAVGQASVEWKLDGARIQVHIQSEPAKITIYTRNLNEVTGRLSAVADIAATFDCDTAVLDGEILGYFSEDTPQAFQDTMSALGTDPESGERTGSDHPGTGLRPHFFDLMYLNGRSLIDAPLRERLAALHALAPNHVIPQAFVAADSHGMQTARTILDEALAKGHEGVMIKASDGPYEAGRRGKSWRKVKPVHTLDLVILAAEWGHGRRRGWLSNLHLGARHPDSGEFVMVGKTFKGLTDKLLAWQTEQFQALKTRETDHTVWVRPELVVEIALDGAQTSTRYPGGVALRFARVRGYRPDRDPTSADTLDAIRALLPRGTATSD